jgi:hypothetical protein
MAAAQPKFSQILAMMKAISHHTIASLLLFISIGTVCPSASHVNRVKNRDRSRMTIADDPNISKTPRLTPCTWGQGYRNSIPGLIPGFIDSNATYWAYGFDLNAQNVQKTIRFSGQFPYARYMSLVAYDKAGSTIDQLYDFQIQPLPGQQNPYLPGVDRSVSNRAYEAWLVPQGSSRIGQPNTIVVPAGAKTVVVLLRVYLPDRGRSIDGDAGLPKIEAFDDRTRQSTACPRWSYPLPANTFARLNVEPYVRQSTIQSYRVTGEGYQPNATNPYLWAPLRSQTSEVAVLRYRVPATPKTFAGGGTFTPTTPVRYWSICLTNGNTSGTIACLADEQVIKDKDNWVTLVVGPDSLRNIAKSRNLNFLALQNRNTKPILIFRQILPAASYAYQFTKVPPTKFDNPNPTPAAIVKAQASQYLVEYAPKGIYCNFPAFRQGGCAP